MKQVPACLLLISSAPAQPPPRSVRPEPRPAEHVGVLMRREPGVLHLALNCCCLLALNEARLQEKQQPPLPSSPSGSLTLPALSPAAGGAGCPVQPIGLGGAVAEDAECHPHPAVASPKPSPSPRALHRLQHLLPPRLSRPGSAGREGLRPWRGPHSCQGPGSDWASLQQAQLGHPQRPTVCGCRAAPWG